ncbi:MAG: hypothetical protein ABEK01_00935 [Candidatus Nanohaloarchaea archaeon]
MEERSVYAGIQLTALSAFLAAYGGSNLALPGFGLAVLGTALTGYGLVKEDL